MKKSLLYTGTGDAGKTSLVGGARVDKDDVRLEAYGTVDELNSWIGLLSSVAMPEPETAKVLQHVQNKMFNIGAYLATDNAAAHTAVNGLTDSDILLLENAIDRLDNMVPPLHRFVLPGGATPASVAHVCRTVCRRAERRIISLSHVAHVDPLLLRYINRLSDFLFVYARFINIDSEADEIFWDKDC